MGVGCVPEHGPTNPAPTTDRTLDFPVGWRNTTDHKGHSRSRTKRRENGRVFSCFAPSRSSKQWNQGSVNGHGSGSDGGPLFFCPDWTRYTIASTEPGMKLNRQSVGRSVSQSVSRLVLGRSCCHTSAMLRAEKMLHSGGRSILLGFLALLVIACGALPSTSPGDLESPDSPAFLADIRQHCLNATGDERAFDELKGYISSELPRCFMAHVNMDQLKLDTSKLEDKDRGKLFENICDQINESVVCLKPVMAKLKPCLDKEDVKIMEQVVATIPEALNMACTNSGALLQKFTEPTYRSCAMELPPMIEECTGELPDSMENLPFSQYTDKQCQEIYSMRDCFSRRINDCGATGFMDFFILFYRKLLSLTPCK
uniref:Uncharacterized protein n=1 Tax=Anopheles atroparvus TaxID=41427 RepID=A0A182J952_ANOAO